MTLQKKYLHDRTVLLLLSVNMFFAVLTLILILLRVSSGEGADYIVQYRANLGFDAFKTGTASDMLSFLGFTLLVLVTTVVLSVRTYQLRRQLSLAILTLGLLLIILSLTVSNALLVLR